MHQLIRPENKAKIIKNHYFRWIYSPMINILVPTDFSALSKVAVQYAIKIARKLNGRITLLHVVTINKPTRVTMHERIHELEEDLIRFAERDLNKLIKEVYKSMDNPEHLKYSVVRGDFMEVVKKEARRLKTGLIVMGTKGASGLKKAVVGSNTASVIEGSKVPVIAVPSRAKFKGFKEIVYACDMKNPERELKMLRLYADQFGSVIHLVHVASSGKDVDELEEKIDKMVKKLRCKNIVSLVLVDRDVEGAIDQYIGVCKADLLTMFTHDLSFYEKLFDKSMTRKMTFHSSIPLLAFKKTS
jgi:nucleotide-binding universal stress UspA family protein